MLPADMPRDAVIVTRNLKREYVMGGETVRALRGVDLTIRRNEYVAIMGPSGSGKSTLMNLIGCLDTPVRGRVLAQRPPGVGAGRRRAGPDPEPRDRVRLPDLQPAAPRHRPAERRAAAGLRRHARRSSGSCAAEEALTRVGLGDRMTTAPTSCPAASASASPSRARWSTSPSILLADEPTGNLDSKTSEEIMALFEQLHAEGQTIILVTHEHDIAAHARRQVHLKDGRVERDFHDREDQLMRIRFLSVARSWSPPVQGSRRPGRSTRPCRWSGATSSSRRRRPANRSSPTPRWR